MTEPGADASGRRGGAATAAPGAATLRELLDLHDDLVVVARADDGRCVHANLAFAHFVGRSAQALAGAHLPSLLEDTLGPAAAALWDDTRHLADQGAPAPTPRWFDVGGLGVRGLQCRWHAWHSEDGLALRALVARPLSERRSATRPPATDAAAAHERQREAMRQADKLSAMGQLLAGMSHELNNPLAIVLSRAALLEEKCEDPSLRHDVERLREAAQRCGRIVRTFLDMARSRPPQVGPVDLNALCEAACELVAYGMRAHGISIEFALDAELPAAMADADQVGQVVLNLLVNAQQVLQGHDGVRRIRVASRRDGPVDAVLEVTDSGPGVPPALGERIFEPFFTTKPPGRGTGLGLSVSRTLLREHGGELLLGTGPLAGACFVVRLPLAADDAPSTGLRADMPALAPAEGLVLVVDDEPAVSELIRDLLEGEGYDVVCVDSGTQALAWLDEHAPDVIVSDLRMPDMDGERLREEVDARDAGLARRILFVTGDTLSHDGEALLRDNGCLVLEKPFDNDELLQAVADLANRA